MDVRLFIEPQQGSTYEMISAVARAAEAGGFTGLFSSDHYLAQGGQDGFPGPCDAWTTMAALSRETRGIRLGTLVSPVTFRLPGVLSVVVAQVDAMSGGRVELGLGTGWDAAEHRSYGIPFPPVAERFQRLEEQLRILIGLWHTSEAERFSFAGRHYTLIDTPALPRPVQPGGPPLIVGGRSLRAARLAARFAAEHNVPFEGPQRVRELFADSGAACETNGRDPNTLTRSVLVNVCCATDDADARRRRAVQEAHRGAFREAGTCWGPPDAVVERLADYADAGASRCYLQFLDLSDLAQLELIACSVLPALQT